MRGPRSPPLHLHPAAFPLGPRSPAPPSSTPAASAHARSPRTPSTPEPALAPPTPSVSVSSYETAPVQSAFYFDPSSTNRHSTTSPLASTSRPPGLPPAPSGFARVLGRNQSVRTVREASEVFAEAKQLYLSGIAAVEKQRKGKSSTPVVEGREDELAAGLFRQVSVTRAWCETAPGGKRPADGLPANLQARKVFLEIGESARADKCTWQICMIHANRGLAEKRASRLDDALGHFTIVGPGWRPSHLESPS